MRAVAITWLGIAPSEADRMTLVEFAAAYDAWLEIRDALDRAAWERTRWQTHHLLTPHLKPDARGKSAAEVFPFPWELADLAAKEAAEADALSDQRLRGLAKKMARGMKLAPHLVNEVTEWQRSQV